MEIARLLATVLTGSALMLTGCTAEGIVEKLTPGVESGIDQEAAFAKAFGGPIDQKLAFGDGFVAVSPERDGARQIGFHLRQGEAFKLAGQKVQVTSGGAVTLSQENGWVVLQTTKDGAPQFSAFKTSAEGMEPVDYYAFKAPEPADKQGHHVVVNKHLNALWHYQDGKLVKAYRVATGRDTKGPQPTWDDFKTNYVTPVGSFVISNMVVNPGYTTLKPGEKNYEGGHPDNPLGTRWMGFEVLKGDNAWIWAIHGTSEPEKIGTWASDGCIRMKTKDAEELYARLKGKSATVQVVAR